MLRHTRAPALIVAASLTALPLTACSDSDTATPHGKISAVASFYPIEFALKQIGGDHVVVTDLTKPGVEPHDLDLSPQQVASIGEADRTFYVKGFQTAVAEAITAAGSAKKAVNLAPSANLTLKVSQTQTVGGSSEESGDPKAADPHFWLDPVRYRAVVQTIAHELGEADPAHRSDYAANAARLVTQLNALDADYRTGLKSCTNRTIVTGHAAFGYLAQRYGLQQVGVAGVSPDQEPTPQRLADVAAFVKKKHIPMIYSEALVSPKTAQAVATQTGAHVDVLDPIEGVTNASRGRDYLEIMRSNLTTLQHGQGCK